MDNDSRERLTEERERIQENIQDLRDAGNLEPERETAGELSGNDQHPADEGTETFNRERDFSILDSLETELVEIESALGRIDDGTYGTCEVCGAPIVDERIQALPATRFCVEHGAAREAAR